MATRFDERCDERHQKNKREAKDNMEQEIEEREQREQSTGNQREETKKGERKERKGTGKGSMRAREGGEIAHIPRQELVSNIQSTSSSRNPKTAGDESEMQVAEVNREKIFFLVRDVAIQSPHANVSLQGSVLLFEDMCMKHMLHENIHNVGEDNDIRAIGLINQRDCMFVALHLDTNKFYVSKSMGWREDDNTLFGVHPSEEDSFAYQEGASPTFVKVECLSQIKEGGCVIRWSELLQNKKGKWVSIGVTGTMTGLAINNGQVHFIDTKVAYQKGRELQIKNPNKTTVQIDVGESGSDECTQIDMFSYDNGEGVSGDAAVGGKRKQIMAAQKVGGGPAKKKKKENAVPVVQNRASVEKYKGKFATYPPTRNPEF
jgi:hypothetical protein